LLILNLGVLNAIIHHIQNTFHHLGSVDLNQLQNLLVANQIGQSDEELRGLGFHFLVGVIEVAQNPSDDVFVGKLMLAVIFKECSHELKFVND
jgi:hypothetical protein